MEWLRMQQALPEVLKVNAWAVVILAAVVLTALLFALEHVGW